MKRLSIVVPAYNEAECIAAFARAVFGLGLEHPVELVVVDDGSRDGTLAIVKDLAANDARVRYVSFSRNFGKEAALLAGLRHATGDYVVTMDADLQHDPNLLGDMLAALDSGEYDCVAACRSSRTGEAAGRGLLSRIYFSFMSRIVGINLRQGVMDYRMMTRQVVDAVLSLGETDRFTKGLYEWVGFRTKWIETETPERAAGNTKWSFRSLFVYSLRGILAFTTTPMQFATFFGVLFGALGAVGLVALAVRGIVLGAGVPGWALAVASLLVVSGVQLVAFGILGLYVAGIFREAKRRPVYVVREEK